MHRQSPHVATNLPGMKNREDLPETVAVPVRLLRKLVEDEPGDYAVKEAKALLPRRRIVAVEDDGSNLSNGYLATLPDLLTLLDEAADSVFSDWSGYNFDIDVVVELKARIRAALGVYE